MCVWGSADSVFLGEDWNDIEGLLGIGGERRGREREEKEKEGGKTAEVVVVAGERARREGRKEKAPRFSLSLVFEKSPLSPLSMRSLTRAKYNRAHSILFLLYKLLASLP